MNVLSLFDGISCGQVALERCGLKVDNYFASEIEPNAIKITQRNYPDTIHIGSVVDVSYKDGILYTENNQYKVGKIDLVMGGSPCQGFSLAGKQLNFEDPRSKLFFEYVRLLEEINPTYFLLENNPMKQEYKDIISKYLKTEPIVINSALVSAQNRKRLYWSNLDFSVPDDKEIMLKELVGEYDGIWVYPRGFNKGGVQSYKGKSPTITTSSWQHNFFIAKGEEKRKFTTEECEQLQTLPIGYTEGISENQRYKALGNSWTVEVIAHILKNI